MYMSMRKKSMIEKSHPNSGNWVVPLTVPIYYWGTFAVREVKSSRIEKKALINEISFRIVLQFI